jgi:hypothetical protein
MITLYDVEAFNSARGIGNPLHDNDTARALGYPSALVPGVDVYGYLTYGAVMRWGASWLATGAAKCKLLKPVFDGERAQVVTRDFFDQNLALELRVGGELRAVAEFSLLASVDRPAINLPRRPLPIERPDGNEESLASGVELGTLSILQSDEEAGQFLIGQRERSDLYTTLAVVHPAYLLRTCNFALSRNVTLGSWIHAASEIRNFDTIPLSSRFELRAKVAANYEKRGHRFVDLDIMVLNAAGAVASLVRHTAAYAPRNRSITESR